MAARICIDMARLHFLVGCGDLMGEIQSRDLCKYHSLRPSGRGMDFVVGEIQHANR
jgi:hypothetical protein